MNRRSYYLLIATGALLIATLLLVRPTSGQTSPSIQVTDADTTLTVGNTRSTTLEASTNSVQTRFVFRFLNTRLDIPLVPQPQALKDSLAAVEARMVVRFANTIQGIPLGIRPPALEAALNAVQPRIVVRFANTIQTTGLTFPCGPACEKDPPQVNSIETEPQADKRFVIRWKTNEPTQSKLEYGDTSGNYHTTLTDDLYTTDHELILSNIEERNYYYRVIATDVSGNVTQTPELQFRGVLTTGNPLVLIYAVLDNNLGDDTDQWQRLVTNVERGAANRNITVRLLIDSPGANNAYVYALTGGAPCITLVNPTCNGRYSEGTNVWRVDEDTAHPKALYDFVNDALSAHSDASQVLLSLVGHGSGWTANALPSQPSSWGDQPSRDGANQEQVGGLLWDDTAGGNSGTRALSTKALGIALGWINNATGRKLDLLYLDACSMGMAEVADEIAPTVDYLLASPNTAWASFTYDAMLAAITPGMSAEAVGIAWLNAEKAALDAGQPDYPYTLALYRLAQMDGLATAVGTLVAELSKMVSGQRALVEATLGALERYESDYDGRISGGNDHYGDLGSFLSELQSRAGSNQPLTAAISVVQSALTDLTVGEPAFGNGTPHPHPGQRWEWQNAKGLGIYLPRANDPKRTLYTGDNLRWVQRSGWDQFLEAMGMVIAADAMGTELPTCAATTQCAGLPRQLPVEEAGVEIYLPVILR